MSEGKQKPLLRVPVSKEPRLPEGVTAEALCNTKGRWPKRVPCHEELLDTYKSFFSSRFRAETLMVLEVFRREYGDSTLEVMDKMYYDMGMAEGTAEKEHYGCLLNKLLDIYVRPYSYDIENIEATEQRSEYRILKCPFAEVVKEMGLEEIGRHLCVPWHDGYAEAMGYRVRFCEFLLDGGRCCHNVWEKVE